MLSYIRSFYSTLETPQVVKKNEFFDLCLEKLRKNNDDTSYEFIERTKINNLSIPDLHKSTLILVKYKAHIPLNQIVGICVSAKDSNGEEVKLVQNSNPDINILRKIFNQFDTKIDGIMTARDQTSFQNVDAIIYTILSVRFTYNAEEIKEIREIYRLFN